MSLPSVVDKVMTDLSPGVANEAVTPVVDCKPLIAAAKLLKSDLSVTTADTELPFNVIDNVPALARLPKVALLVAVAVIPMFEAAVLMAAAMVFASAPTAYEIAVAVPLLVVSAKSASTVTPLAATAAAAAVAVPMAVPVVFRI